MTGKKAAKGAADTTRCECGKPAIIFRAYEGRALCKAHFTGSVEKKVLATIKKHRLIARGDRIAVGLSGGKDSSLVLWLLKKLQPRLGLKLHAILIDEGISGYRNVSIEYARRFCERLEVPLNIVSFKEKVGKTLDEVMASNPDKDIRACTYCGVWRRDLLNKAAREIGADKIAIGHNLDDEAQSIMANWMHGDVLRAARIGAKAAIVDDDTLVPRIKPLREIPEKEVALYALLNRLDADFHSDCPYAPTSLRWEIREMINELEAKHPGTKYNIVRTFDKVQPAIKTSLKEIAGEAAAQRIGRCGRCGEATSQAMCKACELREIVKVSTPPPP